MFDPSSHNHRPSPESEAFSIPAWWWGYDGDQLLLQFGQDGSYVEEGFYVWGPTGPIMEIGINSQYATYMFDPNGSLVNRIWSGGTGIEPALLFDAYGFPVYGAISGGSFPGNGPMPFTYKGQAGYATETGLGNGNGFIYQCQHRWYDPYSGRWLSRDPAGLEGGENAYEFCSGNPLMRVDPSGLQTEDSVTSYVEQLMAHSAEDPEGTIRELTEYTEEVGSKAHQNIIKNALRRIFGNQKANARGILHSLKHAREYFGLGKDAVLTAKQQETWGSIINTVWRSNSIFRSWVGGDQTIAFVGRYGGRAFVLHFFANGERAGQLATIFEISSRQASEFFEIAKEAIGGPSN